MIIGYHCDNDNHCDHDDHYVHDDHCDPSNYDISWIKDQDDQNDPDVFKAHNHNEYHNEFWTNNHDDLCDPIDPNDQL